jgi:hypothetical protein
VPEPVSFATEVFAVVAQKACGAQKIGPQLRHGRSSKRRHKQTFYGPARDRAVRRNCAGMDQKTIVSHVK